MAALVWVSAVAGYVWFVRAAQLSPLEAAEELRGVLADNWWGPVLFIVAYALRPLVLFPASILTVLGGVAFGPFWGVVWTVLASNLSAATAYATGRFFGSGATADRLVGLFGPVGRRAAANPFAATLTMRLLYLPFDPVGYLAGFLRLRFASFISASALGTLPGTAAFVGFGASVGSLDEGIPSLDWRIAAGSAALAIAGALMSRWQRSRVDEAETASLGGTP